MYTKWCPGFFLFYLDLEIQFQIFQFLRQITGNIEHCLNLGILYYLISIIKEKKSQSVKTNFILTTRTTSILWINTEED